MKKKLAIIVILSILTAFFLTGCIPGDGKNTVDSPAGFFWGVWHGMILPVTFIISLFNEARGVFEHNNNGAWYAIGFATGVLFMLSSLGVTRRKKKKNR